MKFILAFIRYNHNNLYDIKIYAKHRFPLYLKYTLDLTLLMFVVTILDILNDYACYIFYSSDYNIILVILVLMLND